MNLTSLTNVNKNNQQNHKNDRSSVIVTPLSAWSSAIRNNDDDDDDDNGDGNDDDHVQEDFDFWIIFSQNYLKQNPHQF